MLLPGAGPVIRPRGVDLHYEVELALVIGKTLKNMEATDEAAAMEAVDCELLAVHTTHLTVR